MVARALRGPRIDAIGVYREGGNKLLLAFIFFAKARYASRASTCVLYVLSLFIHILRYLSAPTSFSAAYQPPFDVCFRFRAKFLPVRPVMPLICFKQAVLRSATSGGPLLEGSSSAELDADELTVVFERQKLGRSILGDEGFDASGLMGAVFERFSFGDATLGEETFSLSFDDEEAFGGATFRGVSLGDGTFEAEVLEDDALDLDFEGVSEGNAPIVFGDGAFDGVAFGAGAFAGVAFGGAAFLGDSLGNAPIGSAFGDEGFLPDALFFVGSGGGGGGVCAADCPLASAASCCNRSLTLRDMLFV